MSPIRRDSKYRDYGPNGRDVTGHRARQDGQFEYAPRRENGVRGSTTLKLQAQVGNRKFEKPKNPSLPNFAERDRLAGMVTDVIF